MRVCLCICIYMYVYMYTHTHTHEVLTTNGTNTQLWGGRRSTCYVQSTQLMLVGRGDLQKKMEWYHLP